MSRILERLAAADKPDIAARDHNEDEAGRPGGAAGTGGAPVLVPIASGKGGVGKTNLAVNLALVTALEFEKEGMGRSVVLVDGDLGLPNADLVLGVRPDRDIGMFIGKNVEDLEEVMVPTRYPNLHFIAGAAEATIAIGNLYYQVRRKIGRHIGRISADLTVFDLGASASIEVLDFFSSAPAGIIVTNPEPPAMRDAYVLLKNALLRRMKRAINEKEARGFFEEKIAGEKRILEAEESLEREGYPDAAREARRARLSFRPYLVMNRVESFGEGVEASGRLRRSAENYLGVGLRYLGPILEDPEIRRSVKASRPAAIAAPDSKAIRCIKQIRGRLFGETVRKEMERNFFDFGSYLKRLLGGGR